MGLGDWSRAARVLFPGATIHAFEPLPLAFEHLNRLHGITGHPFARGATPGEATLDRTTWRRAGTGGRPRLDEHVTGPPSV